MQLFAALLGQQHYKIEEVESEGVRTSFFELGGVKIELLEATHEDSPIAKFIEKKGEGIHHLAFSVRIFRKALNPTKRKALRLFTRYQKRVPTTK